MPTLVGKVLCPAWERLFRGTEESSVSTPFFPHHTSIASFNEALELRCRICMSIWDKLSEGCRTSLRRKKGESQVSRYNRYFGGTDRLDPSNNHYVVVDMCPDMEISTFSPRRFTFAIEPFDGRRVFNPGLVEFL